VNSMKTRLSGVLDLCLSSEYAQVGGEDMSFEGEWAPGTQSTEDSVGLSKEQMPGSLP
jgi:hypothetical protein